MQCRQSYFDAMEVQCCVFRNNYLCGKSWGVENVEEPVLFFDASCEAKQAD